MRSILTATACAAILSASAQAQSTWTEFNFADQGFAVSFPGDPAVGHLKVKTPDGADADETLYALRQDDAIYRMTVIDYKDMMVDGNKAIDQAIVALRERGSVNLDLPARVNRNRGRQLSITEKDGSHSTVAIFFGDHRLYQIEGTELASSADPSSGEMIRFQQSLRFTGPDNGFGGGFDGQGFGRGDGNGGPPGAGFRGGRRFRRDGDPPQNPPADAQPQQPQGNG
ncbi:MAG: hypothetical protein KGO48_05900 [Alphaproteobacteria bacterium]|nr:hypothetical protein [Alphaproteobacteria bacterium]